MGRVGGWSQARPERLPVPSARGDTSLGWSRLGSRPGSWRLRSWSRRADSKRAASAGPGSVSHIWPYQVGQQPARTVCVALEQAWGCSRSSSELAPDLLGQPPRPPLAAVGPAGPLRPPLVEGDPPEPPD